jgi:hypothetical protein
MLLHAALFRTIALPWLPSLLTPAFVAAGAVLCWAAGRGLFARESLR